jgi:hypothetical protein
MEVNNRIHSPPFFLREKFLRTHWTLCWMGSGYSLNILKNSEISFPGRTPDRLAQCFPNFVASGPLLAHQNSQVSSYPSWRKYGTSGWQVSKIKNLYLRTDIRYLRIHTSDIHNNALRYLTLIKLNVPRFVGRACFLVRYSNRHTRWTPPIKEVPLLFFKKYIKLQNPLQNCINGSPGIRLRITWTRGPHFGNHWSRP